MTRNAWRPSNWIFTPYVRMGNTLPARSGKVDDLRFRQAMPQATPSHRRTYTNGAGAGVLSLRIAAKIASHRGAPTHACRVDTRVDAWRYLTLVAAPLVCTTPLQILRSTRRFHSPRGAGFQARNADILVGASGRAPILVAAPLVCITPFQILRGTRRFHGPRGAGFQARNADILVGALGRAPILVAAPLVCTTDR